LKRLEQSEKKFRKDLEESSLTIENETMYFQLIESIKDLITIRSEKIFKGNL
jgi:hypothetical protein